MDMTGNHILAPEKFFHPALYVHPCAPAGFARLRDTEMTKYGTTQKPPSGKPGACDDEKLRCRGPDFSVSLPHLTSPQEGFTCLLRRNENLYQCTFLR